MKKPKNLPTFMYEIWFNDDLQKWEVSKQRVTGFGKVRNGRKGFAETVYWFNYEPDNYYWVSSGKLFKTKSEALKKIEKIKVLDPRSVIL